jgi:CRP/FNR family transcriptional regulator, cyclic AMP receptor protein
MVWGMARVDPREVLGRIDLFGDLEPSMIDTLVEGGATMTYRPGGVVVEQGAIGGGIQVLLEGGATVVVNGQDVRALGAGDYFGEMSVIDNAPRSATLVAGEAGVKTFAISPMRFASMLDANPGAARLVLAVVVRRLREAEARRSGA